MTGSTGRPLRISVVIPSYNSGRYLREAIESALAQEPPPDQVVVQDGASTDDSVEILSSYGGRVDWRSVMDHGQSEALNIAIARATGEVVVWLNADDVLVPGAFAAVHHAFTSDPEAEFVYGDFNMIGADGRILRRFRSSEYQPDRVFTRGCYIFSGAIYYRRSLLERVGPFDERLHACMDFDYLLRLGDIKAVHVGSTVAGFRMSGEGKSSKMRSRFLRESFTIRRRVAGTSVRCRVFAWALTGRDLLSLYTQSLRLTKAWSTARGSRRL